MPPPAHSLGLRYATWIDAHRWLVLALALVVAGLGAYLASRLQLQADMSSLLPPSQQSVRDLKVLQKRARAFGTVFVVVEAADPEVRKRTAGILAERFRAIDPALLANVTADDRVARSYFWDNRFLSVDLDDLRDARDALDDKIRRAKLEANPLYVSLDDDDVPEKQKVEERIDKLRQRLDEAEAEAKSPAPFVSEDGTLQFLTLRSTFPTSDIPRARKLVGEIRSILRRTQEEMGRGVRFGLTGTVTVSMYEHDSILRGMWLAAIITITLCAIALLAYYKSVLPVAASLWSLAVGVLATFAFTKVAIGHLNLMSAFLTAIVVGNGINAGLILLARYFEEVREGNLKNRGLARAIAGAARGTLAASLTAGVAYGSLVVTDFRGFRHFGLIAGTGMLLCWLSAFTVLPAALCVLRRRGLIRVGAAPALGSILARILPRRPGRVAGACAAVALVSAAAAVHYLATDPFLEDWRDLQSKSTDISRARDWDRRMRESFDRKYTTGLTSRFAIALDRREDVPPLVEQLRAAEKARPPGEGLLAEITSLDDYLPADQEEKLALLADIRRMLDDEIVDEFDDDDQESLERVRPPEDLSAMTIGDVPQELAWPFIEKDGTIGRLILVKGDARFKSWYVDHRVQFAEKVRSLEMPQGAVLGGQSFVIADIIKSMERDGPLAIAVALVGSVLAVWLVVGLRRHGAVTLLCGASGVAAMIALCSAAGIRVHFLDLIALPITIGIGIDYAVNLAARDRQEGELGPQRLLSTTGGAVLLCSFTTIVGYGSLLLSNNGGIRSFGLAALLGEIACVVIALALAPSLLAMLRARSAEAGPSAGQSRK